MNSPKSKKYNLIVNTNDAAAEITILDSQFQRVELDEGRRKLYKSSEQVIISLNTGLYTVKIGSGRGAQEKSIALLNKDETVDFSPVKLSSPAPWEESTKTHEYHVNNAVDESRQVHISIGTGSQIYLFSRIWTDQSSFKISNSVADPAIGFSLRNLNDEILVDLGDPEIGKYSVNGDPWSACNVQLDPGIYCLCFKTDTGTILKQSIVASPGWQTQVFLLNVDQNLDSKRDYTLFGVGSAMSRSSIFMVKIGHGFKATRNGSLPDDPNLRLTELARQALISGRLNLSTDHLHQMLSEKFNNPMLGIYACHLFLMDYQQRNLDLLRQVVGKLRTLLHDPHPDVEAIALKLDMGSNFIFSMPPMLIQSWGFILELSVKQPQIVNENSVASNLPGQLWGSDQWVIWRQSESQPAIGLEFLSDQIKNFFKSEEGIYLGSSLIRSTIVDGNPVKHLLEDFKNNDEKMINLVKSFGIPKSTLDSIMKSIE